MEETLCLVLPLQAQTKTLKEVTLPNPIGPDPPRFYLLEIFKSQFFPLKNYRSSLPLLVTTRFN